MDIVLFLHSWVRWAILLIAVIAAIKFLLGWLNKNDAAKSDRALMSAFSGLIDVQVLLGLILLVIEADFSFPHIEHLITMLVAAVVAHLPMRWRNAMGAQVLRNNLMVIVVAILLIIAGVASLPGNRWVLRGL